MVIKLCENCGKGSEYCQCFKRPPKVNRRGYVTDILGTEEVEEVTDMQALRLIMAAVIYGEIRHEKFLAHSLGEIKPAVLYSSVFEVVDGLIEESKK